jgi:hypothetical protein
MIIKPRRSRICLTIFGLIALARAGISSAGVLPELGIEYGPPLRISSYGDLWLRNGDSLWSKTVWAPSVGVQIGAGGYSASMGLARVKEGFYYRQLATLTFTGRSPLHSVPKAMYAGLHGEVGMVWSARLRIGVETRVGGDRSDTRFVWGIGATPVLPFSIVCGVIGCGIGN